MTLRLCRTCRGWHDLDAPWPCPLPEPPARAAFPAPMFTSDAMRPVVSQVDGRTYDSRSAIRRHYREAGVVEVGNDRLPARPPIEKTTGAEIKAALQKAGLA